MPVAQRVAIRPLSARDGVLPFSFFDRSAGMCATIGLYRLEGVGVADGAPRWSTTAWAYAIGELPDGSVVAVADALAGSGQVQVGVLGRVDGAVRFTCAAPAGIGTLAYNWSAVEGGLRADLSVPVVITGTQMPADAAMAFHEVLLTVSKTGCALSRPAGDPGTPWRLPTSWTAGTITVTDSRAVGAVGPALPDGDALVARRGGRELWRRPLPVELSAPCAIP